MAQIELLLPKMGESVAEATIIKWLKNEGDPITADEPVVEIATDKVDSEVPATDGGILLKRLVNEGDVVAVGQPIAIIGSESASEARPSAPAPAAAAAPAPEVVAEVMAPIASAEVLRTGPSGKFYSPLVRNIAKAEGVTLNELETLSGSGKEGRVTKNDILSYVENRSSTPAVPAPSTNGKHEPEPKPTTPKSTSPEPSSRAVPPRPAVSIGSNDEIIEMDRMRKLIADHMVMSKHTSPHVTSFVEADVTNIVLWREKVKKDFEKKYGTKLTFTPIFVEAVTRAILDFPMINISVDGDRIIKRGSINVGMATALPSGNLIVPVIHNADGYNMSGLARKVNDLADRARNNKLSPDEIQGGTYTITNVGTFGNVLGTPIINQPQVAIMALGAIRKKPAVIETEFGDTLGIRHMMFLSHSYDHRVVDGILGGTFVRRVADYLESFDLNREF
jgi:2-oxoglutarate dehydrogenase E2 component (dihydrolipoamide succinyltransferase)